ncbi:CRISPR-associated protein Cas4 [archaeon]|nr:CRISPR-associated protein Cas4 [archaeon]
MNELISISSVNEYDYCQRKLYLSCILNIKEPIKECVAFGSVKHEIYESINNIDREIVCSIRKETNIGETYLRYYRDIVNINLIKHKQLFDYLKIDLPAAFGQIWQFFEKEAEFRAGFAKRFVEAHNLFGHELWNALTPKFLSEFKVAAKGIGVIGRIDRVAIESINSKEIFIPYELKTGNMPKEGVWPSHRIQLALYMLSLSEQCQNEIKIGYIHYLKDNALRKVVMNPFLKDEALDMLAKVRVLLNSSLLPPITTNENKCKNCGLKERCWGMQQ